MRRVTAQFSMSLDGFIAGPRDEVEQLFRLYFSGDLPFPVPGANMLFQIPRSSTELLQKEWDNVGAIVTGRRDFDASEAWGATSPLGVPIFVLTHIAPQAWDNEGSPLKFVSAGVERAIERAQQVAGYKNVGVSGTKILRQCLQAGLIDEIQIDLVPILLGTGIRLFDDSEPLELEYIRVVEGVEVTHLLFRVVK